MICILTRNTYYSKSISSSTSPFEPGYGAKLFAAVSYFF